MTDIVEGVAALLYTPMADKPVQFGEPYPHTLMDGAWIRMQRRRVGHVEEVWRDTDRILWRGRLYDPDEDAIRVDGTHHQVAYRRRPDVRPLIDDRRLIGMPALTQAITSRRDDGMLLTGWMISTIDLMTVAVAPWPGMELRWHTGEGRSFRE